MVGAGADDALRASEMTADTVTLRVWWKGPGRGLPRFTMNGEKITLGELAKLYRLPEYTVLARVARGLHPSQWMLSSAELCNVRKQEQRRAA